MTALQWASELSWGREVGGQNRGAFVRLCFAVLGWNKEGAPWCAAFVSLCIWLATHGKPPFALSDGTNDLLNAMAAKGLERPAPVSPGVFFEMNKGQSVHTGFISGLGHETFPTIEGNASNPADPPSNNGWGVFWRERKPEPGLYRYFSLEGV